MAPGFKARYEARGYTVIAPSWPFDDRSPAELRASPNPALAKVGIKEIITHYDRLIRAMTSRSSTRATPRGLFGRH